MPMIDPKTALYRTTRSHVTCCATCQLYTAGTVFPPIPRKEHYAPFVPGNCTQLGTVERNHVCKMHLRKLFVCA